MQVLERKLADEYNIRFDRSKNHIRYVFAYWFCCLQYLTPCDRCFPHVVNIAVQTALKALSTNIVSFLDIYDLDSDYADVLMSDVVQRVRTLVHFCRSSSIRREGFLAVIAEGNKRHWWGTDANGNPKELDPLQLLRDVDTRWSSTYLMIDRVLYLLPASNFSFPYKLSPPCISEIEARVLRDIHSILKVFHGVQQGLSYEHTPTLSSVIPTYELLLERLRTMRDELPHLIGALDQAIDKITAYMETERRKPIYALALCMSHILQSDPPC
ncbi:hypothetical protein PENSPDRAFT_585511 [Peniophora sp. CONT]|nr:hypothetical protein PENSPDRAFT_585511 [Peniophora sp. CONT]